MSKKVFSEKIFYKNQPGRPNQRGFDFYQALQEQSKCGIPMIDKLTKKCVSISVVNGVLVVDNDSSTIETFCTYTYTIANPASPASGTLTLTGNALDTETVVINGVTYTFLTTFVDAPGNVKIGATASDSIDNLISAITGVATGSAVEGTDFPTGSTAQANITASQGAGDTMDVTTVNLFGAPADAVATTETLTNGSWGDTTLVLDAATVALAIAGTALANDTYEITSPGVSSKSVNLLASDVKLGFEQAGAVIAGVNASVSGTNYVVEVVINKANQSLLTGAGNLTRDAVTVTPTNDC